MLAGAMVQQAQAADISLFERIVNINGTVIPAGSPPGGSSVDETAFDLSTGLGTITVGGVSGAGNHFVGLFVDHEIDEVINTYFNENGTPVNSASATQSWEIDEPGFVFGDIYTHFNNSDATGSLLDNSNAVPAGSEDDVSMALGWYLNLTAFQTATISYLVSENAPASGFYLQQHDPDSGVSIYFSSSVNIVGGPPGVPDASGTLPLLMGGLLTAWGLMRRKA